MRVSQSGGPGGNASVFVRGTNSNQVLVLRDGMPINDPSDPGGAFNFGVDTLADVERIEIIRGPMAALYGSGAIGGVINLITRAAATSRARTSPAIWPAATRRRSAATANAVRHRRAAGLLRDRSKSQSQRGFDTTPQRECDLYRRAARRSRDRRHDQSRLHAGGRHAAVAAAARPRRAMFGFNESRRSRRSTMPTPPARTTSLLGRVGVTSKLFDGAFETGVFLGRLQDDRQYRETLNPADPNQVRATIRATTAIETDLQWNNTVHLDDLITSSVLSATDLTFGYEHIARQRRM